MIFFSKLINYHKFINSLIYPLKKIIHNFYEFYGVFYVFDHIFNSTLNSAFNSFFYDDLINFFNNFDFLFIDFYFFFPLNAILNENIQASSNTIFFYNIIHFHNYNIFFCYQRPINLNLNRYQMNDEFIFYIFSSKTDF